MINMIEEPDLMNSYWKLAVKTLKRLLCLA